MKKSLAVLTNRKKAIKELSTKDDLSATGAQAATDLVVGAVAGGAAGAAIGRPSFLTGLILSGIGYYKGISWLPTFGLGMMSTSFVKGSDPNVVDGIDFRDSMTKATDRLLSFKDSFAKRLYLDKVADTLSPSSQTVDGVPLDFTALDQYQQQFIENAHYAQQRTERQEDDVVSDIDFDDMPDF